MVESLKIVKITGKIRVKTGLKISAGKDNVSIGGLDNMVIKNPKDRLPYIPGSSIKGKMRFLLEWAEGKVEKDGSPHNCGEVDCPVCSVFGSTKYNAGEDIRPTRLIVRDAFLSEGQDTDNLLEAKTENYIDRITGKAGSPRTLERVIPGVEFDFECILRIFPGDNEEGKKKIVLKALALLQRDYLGGSGSRGYGKIAFVSNNKEGYVVFGEEEEELESYLAS
ncbi:MAG: type III-A CRISPR-associated RAMP protein Csm3 [Candidatus Omnitrophota bacterium]|nr:MAG: type III-A CRISPR-associated RAMP protein Csm3 [Candidatus Omnitrophota bacterium]